MIGGRLSMQRRARVAAFLGMAVMIYVLVLHLWRQEIPMSALQSVGTAEIGSDGISVRVCRLLSNKAQH